jgi:hypothetical protein
MKLLQYSVAGNVLSFGIDTVLTLQLVSLWQKNLPRLKKLPRGTRG